MKNTKIENNKPSLKKFIFKIMYNKYEIQSLYKLS